MSVPANIIRNEPTRNYFLPIAEIRPTSEVPVFLEAEPSPTLSVADVFRDLANKWRRDTGHLSLISQRVKHPAYKRVLLMGSDAVPLILEEMRDRPDHWFHALITLTDDNPVPFDFNGTVEDAAALWVAWGQDNGLISP